MRNFVALIADSNPVDSSELARSLSSLGVTALVSCDNVAEAEALLRGQRAQRARTVVFVKDEPHAEVAPFIRRVMKDEALSETFIVVTSGADDEHRPLWAFQLGAIGYLRFPLDPNRLRKVMDQINRLRMRAS